MLSFTAGDSKDIGRMCRKYSMPVIFMSAWSLCSLLYKVKDACQGCVLDPLQLWLGLHQGNQEEA